MSGNGILPVVGGGGGGAAVADASSGTGSAERLPLQKNKHLNVIGEEVRNSFQGDANADAKIVCDGGAIVVHRLVLASASPWLKSIFEDLDLHSADQFYTILLPDVRYHDMLRLIKFIYGGEVTVSLYQLGSLQELIKLLQLDPRHANNGKLLIENINDNESFTRGISMTVVGASAGGNTTPQPVAIPIDPLNHQQFHAYLISPGGQATAAVERDADSFVDMDTSTSASINVTAQPKPPVSVAVPKPTKSPRSKASASYDDFKRHEKGHQPKFPCEVCEKDFSTKWSLATHVKTHTGEKPFTCVFCKFSFAQKAHLIKHLSTMHRYPNETNGTPFGSAVKVGDKAGSREDGKDDFSCCFCGEPLENKDAIGRHISQNHGDMLTKNNN